MFSQGVAVLFEPCPSLATIEKALEPFSIAKRVD
jgi:hypothetical protein